MTTVDVPQKKRAVRKVLMHMRMCDTDRDAYGGDEWLTFDPEYAEDLPARDLIAIEQAARAAGEPITLLPAMFVAVGDEALEAVTLKAKLFLARKQAGLATTWADFQPRLAKVRYRIEPIYETPAPDADPLDPGSATSPTTPPAEPSPTG